MAVEYGGKHVKAWHSNMPVYVLLHRLLAMTNVHVSGKPPSPLREPLSFLAFLVTPWTAREREGHARTQWFQDKGSGYRAEQSTQPQTLGYSLADSPIGLLAWIYEKLHNWTDDYPWEDDEGEPRRPLRIVY